MTASTVQRVRDLMDSDGGIPRDHNRDVARFYAESVPAWASRGLFGLLIPQEFGGLGLSVPEYVAAMEVIGEHDTMASYSINEHSTIGSLPLVTHGSHEQKQRWLPDMAAGRALGAFCLTEPASGSDVTSLATKAEPTEDGYRLNGKKIHISLAHHASLFTVLAEVPDGHGGQQKTAFLVPRDRAGVSNGPENSSPTGYLIPVAGSVVFEDVHLTDDDVLGTVGGGGRIFKSALETARIGLPSGLVGGVNEALTRAVERLSTRKSFGQPLTSHQMVQAKLADIAIQVEASRQMLAHAARVIDETPDAATGVSAMAKVFSTESMRDAGADLIQLFGGAAFLEEPPLDWHMRDAKMSEILGGTSEVMRLLIAKEIIGTRRAKS